MWHAVDAAAHADRAAAPMPSVLSLYASDAVCVAVALAATSVPDADPAADALSCAPRRVSPWATAAHCTTAGSAASPASADLHWVAVAPQLTWVGAVAVAVAEDESVAADEPEVEHDSCSPCAAAPRSQPSVEVHVVHVPHAAAGVASAAVASTAESAVGVQ